MATGIWYAPKAGTSQAASSRLQKLTGEHASALPELASGHAGEGGGEGQLVDQRNASASNVCPSVARMNLTFPLNADAQPCSATACWPKLLRQSLGVTWKRFLKCCRNDNGV